MLENLTRREFIRLSLLSAIVPSLNEYIISGSSIKESKNSKKRIKNVLILDMNAKPKNYETNEICNKPLNEATKCRGSGLINYLKLSGKPALLEFMAYWCGPCRIGTPIINEVYEKYGDVLEVVGLNPIIKNENLSEAIEKTKNFLTHYNVKFPTFMMKESHAIWFFKESLGKTQAYLPVTILLNSDMEIIYENETKLSGLGSAETIMKNHKERLYEEIESLLYK